MYPRPLRRAERLSSRAAAQRERMQSIIDEKKLDLQDAQARLDRARAGAQQLITIESDNAKSAFQSIQTIRLWLLTVMTTGNVAGIAAALGAKEVAHDPRLAAIKLFALGLMATFGVGILDRFAALNVWARSQSSFARTTTALAKGEMNDLLPSPKSIGERLISIGAEAAMAVPTAFLFTGIVQLANGLPVIPCVVP